MTIRASVGQGGINQKKDVQYIQLTLNVWRQKHNRVPIKVDGKIGPETIGAIRDFQQTVTKIVDGRVDPAGASEKALELEFLPLAQEMEVYCALAIVLSFQPPAEVNVLNSRELVSLLQRVAPPRIG